MSKEPTNAATLVEYQAETLGDKAFLYFEDQVISFSELNRRVNLVANGLSGLGVKAGVGVCILMGNSPEFIYVYLAINKLNAYAVPVNTGLKGEGLHHIIDHSDARVLVMDETFREEIGKIVDNLGKLETVVVNQEEETDLTGNMRSLASVMDASDENPGVTIVDGEMSALLYTSGTTGAPKGVVSRYRSAPMQMGGALFGGVLGEDDMMYTCLPLFHANALHLTTMRAVALGLPMALSRRFSASRFWDEIRRYGVTTFNGLGAMIPILMKQPERDNDNDNPVKVVMSAACPASVWEAFENRFNVRIFEGYGSVDGGGFSIGNYGNGPKGSLGKPANEYRLVDDEDNDVPVGTSGELIFKVDDAKLRRVEYYKNEEASNAKIVDGWFHTGDMLHADADGWLYFDDRKTDSMRRRGENISAWEVERAINAHAAVFESAVIGVPSDLGEDDVMAIVILQPDQSLSEEALIEHCENSMAKFMIPRYIEFRKELPKTGTLRVQKAVLKREGVGADTWDREAVMGR
jgi:crotonobetaine/carnitine-CoA ligase